MDNSCQVLLVHPSLKTLSLSVCLLRTPTEGAERTTQRQYTGREAQGRREGACRGEGRRQNCRWQGYVELAGWDWDQGLLPQLLPVRPRIACWLDPSPLISPLT